MLGEVIALSIIPNLILGKTISEIQENRTELCREFAKENNIKEVPIPAFATIEETPISEEYINRKAEIEIQKRVNTRLRETHVLDNMLSKKDYMIILKMLKDKDKYNVSIVLMTDGIPNIGSLKDLRYDERKEYHSARRRGEV